MAHPTAVPLPMAGSRRVRAKPRALDAPGLPGRRDYSKPPGPSTIHWDPSCSLFLSSSSIPHRRQSRRGARPATRNGAWVLGHPSHRVRRVLSPSRSRFPFSCFGLLWGLVSLPPSQCFFPPWRGEFKQCCCVPSFLIVTAVQMPASLHLCISAPNPPYV